MTGLTPPGFLSNPRGAAFQQMQLPGLDLLPGLAQEVLLAEIRDLLRAQTDGAAAVSAEGSAMWLGSSAACVLPAAATNVDLTPDDSTLYVTAGGGLYRVRLAKPRP